MPMPLPQVDWPNKRPHPSDSFLLVLIGWAIMVRFLYSLLVTQPIIAPDTYGYWAIGQRIVGGVMPILNDERTPVYPLFLALVANSPGELQALVASPGFWRSAFLIVWLQSFIGILGLVIFYQMLRRLQFPPLPSRIFSLFIATNIMLFSWERILLTESLTIFFLMIVTSIFVSALQQPTRRRFSLLLIASSFGFLLKPIYLALPYIMFPLIIWFHHKREVVWSTLLALSVYTMLPLIYLKTNEVAVGYRGINHVTDINLLGKILKYHLPVDAGKNQSRLYQAILSYRHQDGAANPYAFLDYYHPQLLLEQNKHQELNELQSFVKAVVVANIPQYAMGSLGEIPSALVATDPFTQPAIKPGWLGLLFKTLWDLFAALQYLSLIFLPLFLITLMGIIQHQSGQAAAMLSLGLVVLYQIMATVFGGYGEFGRLVSVVQPQLYLFCFWTIGWIITTLKRS